MNQDARRFAAHRVAVRAGATAVVALAALAIPMTPGYGRTPAAKTAALMMRNRRCLRGEFNQPPRMPVESVIPVYRPP